MSGGLICSRTGNIGDGHEDKYEPYQETNYLFAGCIGTR
jgi:hypothetical protein